jgi:hypothetical protein
VLVTVNLEVEAVGLELLDPTQVLEVAATVVMA